jgi:hypothetical protein
MAFNPWSAGKLLVWNRFGRFLPRGSSVGFESLRCTRFVNCFDRMASLCEDERSRRTLMLFAGDGGKEDGGVESSLFTSFPVWLAAAQPSPGSLFSLSGGVTAPYRSISISAISSSFLLFRKIQASSIASLLGVLPFQNAFGGMARGYLRGRSPIRSGRDKAGRGYVHQCIMKLVTAYLPPVSVASSSERQLRSRRQCITASMFILNRSYACHHPQVTLISLGVEGDRQSD